MNAADRHFFPNGQYDHIRDSEQGWVLYVDHAAALSASEERERKLREILSSLYVGTRLIDNGHCAICRIGHRGWRPGHKSTEAGLCSNADCLSRRVEAALAPEGGTNG